RSLFPAHPGTGVDLHCGVLVRAGGPFGDRFLRPEVMARGEDRADATENDDADLVVALGCEERVVEFDEQPAILGVASPRPVEHDPSDQTFVERLIRDVPVISHGNTFLRNLEATSRV